MAEHTIDVSLEEGESTPVNRVHVRFGPHYFLEVKQDGEKVRFVLGATHHGFLADASEIGGELEGFIYKIRELYPGNTVD